MYKKLRLKNFRAFEDFEMDLAPITLIAGDNNVGKSSILEAVFLGSKLISNRNIFIDVLYRRGEYDEDITYRSKFIWVPLFNRLDMNNNLEICLLRDNEEKCLILGKEKSEEYDYDEDNTEEELYINYKDKNYEYEGVYGIAKRNNIYRKKIKSEGRLKINNVTYIRKNLGMDNQELSDEIGELELNDRKKSIVDALNIIDKDIKNIYAITENGEAKIYIEKQNKIKYPLNVLGDGVRNLLEIILVLLRGDKKVLIDEIENGFHYSTLEKLWEIIARISKENLCQVIVTTHSSECIKAAASTFNNLLESDTSIINKEDIRYIRLEKKETKIVAKTYDLDMIENAIEYRRELR